MLFRSMDLLTVVMHELGHMLGLADETQAGATADLMFETLAPGVRRLPDAILGAPAPGKGVPGSSPLADTAGSGPASSQQAIIDAAFASLAPGRPLAPLGVPGKEPPGTHGRHHWRRSHQPGWSRGATGADAARRP